MIVYECDICEAQVEAQYFDDNRTRPPDGWSRLTNSGNGNVYNLCPDCDPIAAARSRIAELDADNDPAPGAEASQGVDAPPGKPLRDVIREHWAKKL